MTKTQRNTAHLIAILDAIKARSAAVGLNSFPDVQTMTDLTREGFNVIADGISRVVVLEQNDTLKPEFQQASIQSIFDEVSAKVQAVASDVEARAQALVQAVSMNAAPKMPFSDPTAAEVALLNARTLAGAVMDRAAAGQKAAALLDLYERAKKQGDAGMKYLLGATDWAELMLTDPTDLNEWQQGTAARFAEVAPAEAQKARQQLQAAREWLNVPRVLLAGLRELTSPDDVNFFEAFMIEDLLNAPQGAAPDPSIIPTW